MSDRRKEDIESQDDDPYASIAENEKNVMEVDKKESARSRKWRQFKQKFEMAKGHMKQSFIMGAMVGGGFGFILGLYNAVTYKSWIILPLLTITSSGSFGFFLMCGSLIRMDPMIKAETPQLNYLRANLDTKEIERGDCFLETQVCRKRFLRSRCI